MVGTMEQKCEDLWEQAKSMLHQELGDREWDIFVAQSKINSVTVEDTINSLQHTSNKVGTRYGTHKVKVGKKQLFEFNIGRILTRLDILFRMVDSTMSFAPQLASVVWTAFRMLFDFFLIDKETCEFLSGAVDQISNAVFVCEICAKRYLTKAGGISGSIAQMIPGVYVSVLRFSFETKKFVDSHPLRQACGLLSGKLEFFKIYLSAATEQLQALERRVDIGFKETVENILAGMNKDVGLVATLVPRISDQIHGLREGNERIEAGNQRIEAATSRLEGHIEAIVADQGKEKDPDRDNAEKEHEECLQKLQSQAQILGLNHPTGHLKTILDRRSPRSCQWILEDKSYLNWLTNGDLRILLLSAAAGFGKSFLSSTVIDSLRENSTNHGDYSRPLVIFFFCEAGNDASQKGERIMLHLLMQLFNYSDPEKLSPEDLITTQSCVKAITDALEDSKDPEDYDSPKRSLNMSELGTMFNRLVRILNRRVFIVLDALDECNDWADCNLLGSLLDLSNDDDRICLMLSSRPSPKIETVLKTKRIDAYRVIEVDKERNGPIIAAYVDGELDSVEHLKLSQKHRAREVIAQKSEGMFRYASIAVETLKSPKSAAAFNKTLQDLPRGMNDLYKKKMQSLDADYRDWLIIALRWLVCGEGSISTELIVDEILRHYRKDEFGDEGIIEKQFNDEEEIPSDPNGAADQDNRRRAVIIEALSHDARDFLKLEPNDTVTLQHKSVRDWVEEDAKLFEARRAKTTECQSCLERQRQESTYEAASKWGHILMARNIMLTLNDINFQKRFHLKDDTDKGSDFDNDLTDGHRNRNLRYELTHWPYHVLQAEKQWTEYELVTERDVQAIFTEVYDLIEEFMTAGSLTFKRWRDLIWAAKNDTKIHPKPVIIAARFNLVGMLKRYVSAKTDLDAGGSAATTALHVCGMTPTGYIGYLGLEFMLQQPDPPVNSKSKNGLTPLLQALRGDAAKRHIELLVEHGARPDTATAKDVTCLHFTARRGDLDLCRLILNIDGVDANASVNAKDWQGETPLHWASSSPNPSLEVVELLLEKGANVNEEDNDSQMPLFKACLSGNTNIAHLLMKKGADVNDSETVHGWTALHAAVANQRLDLVKVLVRDGADITVKDFKLSTPVTLAAARGSADILGFLLRSQNERSNDMGFLADANINGWTPLHLSTGKGMGSCVKLLLEFGDAQFLCSRTNNPGKTPLHLAATNGWADVVHLLIGAGADARALDNDGNSPLVYASRRWVSCSAVRSAGYENIITALFERSPDLKRKQALKLFGVAIEKGSMDVCRLLTDFTHAEDSHGWTPLLLAVQERQQGIIDLLSQRAPPTRWSTSDKDTRLEVSDDGLEVLSTSNDTNLRPATGNLRTDHPIPPGRSCYYYEITVIEAGDEEPYSEIGLGFSSAYASLAGMPGWPGAGYPSWAYHGDDGCKHAPWTRRSGWQYPRDHSYGPKWGRGDVVGAGIDFAKGVVFFTKNGERLADAFVGEEVKGRLFPVVGMHVAGGVKVRANFGGEPFRWKGEGGRREERGREI